jgi:hypothetical protein
VGGEEPDGAVRGEPPGDVADHGQARSVEPAEVVDRDEQATPVSERQQGLEGAAGHRGLVGRPIAGILEPHGDRERPGLGRRQLASKIGQSFGEQIGEARIGELGFCLGRRAGQDPGAGRPDRLDGRRPDRGLAESRGAFDDEGGRPGDREPAPDGLEVRLASDDLGHGSTRSGAAHGCGRGSSRALTVTAAMGRGVYAAVRSSAPRVAPR